MCSNHVRGVTNLAAENKMRELSIATSRRHGVDHPTCQNFQQFPPPLCTLRKHIFVWDDPGGVELSAFGKENYQAGKCIVGEHHHKVALQWIEINIAVSIFKMADKRVQRLPCNTVAFEIRVMYGGGV